MCRAQTETGRRCPCDTSEARRLRRHNAQARAAHPITAPVIAPLLEEPVVIHEQGLKEPDYSVGGEKMQEIHDLTATISVLKELMVNPRGVNSERPQKITLPTGEKLEILEREFVVTDENGDEVNRGSFYELTSYAEQATIILGNKIHEVIQARSGIKDEELLEDELASIAPAQAELDEAQAKAKNNWENLYAQYGGRDAYHQLRYGGDNPEASQLARDQYEEARALDAAAWEARQKFEQIMREGGEEGKRKLAKQREVLIETLKEIRSLGGEVEVADNSHKKVLASFRETLNVYPSSWVEESNNREPPRIKFTKSRAHYSDSRWQNTAKIVPRRRSVLKPEGWTPDPMNQDELGEWIKMDENNTWKNPDTGVTHEHYTEPGTSGWMRPQLEFASTYRRDPQTKPSGRGWIKAEVWENNKETGNLKTVWYRPSVRRESTTSQSQPEITISGETEEAQRRVALHEFAHRVEASGKTGSYIKALEEQFILRRTTDPTTGEREKLQTIYKGTKERGRADNFVNLYMGKEYDSGYREILSTGAEAVFHNSFGGLVGLGRQKPDLEMKKFIIGLWASA